MSSAEAEREGVAKVTVSSTPSRTSKSTAGHALNTTTVCTTRTACTQEAIHCVVCHCVERVERVESVVSAAAQRTM